MSIRAAPPVHPEPDVCSTRGGALLELRVRRWNGQSLHSRWANIGGQLVTAFGQKKPPFWVWNAGMRQLYLSSYHLSPAHIREYLAALRHHRVDYVFGYASSLYSLARLALEAGINVPKVSR
jgi:phenylacetate-CoA ligase